MPVFRLDGITIQEVESAFTDILLPLDIVAIILLTFVFTISRCYHVYDEFPGSLFLWLLPLDLLYGLFVGPLRWAKNSLFFNALGDVQTMSDGACRWAAFIDTFFQMGSLYLNTCIITTVFYMVFYTASLHGDAAIRSRNLAAIGFFVFSLPLAIASLFVVPYRGVGFCMVDGLVLVIKQTVWYTAILCQIAMVIPTQYQIYKSSRISMKAISKGTYVRFCGIIATQIIGLFPIMLIEAHGLARETVSGTLIYFMAVGFPLGHILDAMLMSIKALPVLLPVLASWFSSWELSSKKKSSKDKTSKEKDSKGTKGSKGSKGHGSKVSPSPTESTAIVAAGNATATTTGTANSNASSAKKSSKHKSKVESKASNSNKKGRKKEKQGKNSKPKHSSKPSKQSEALSILGAPHVKSFAEPALVMTLDVPDLPRPSSDRAQQGFDQGGLSSTEGPSSAVRSDTSEDQGKQRPNLLLEGSPPSAPIEPRVKPAPLKALNEEMSDDDPHGSANSGSYDFGAPIRVPFTALITAPITGAGTGTGAGPAKPISSLLTSDRLHLQLEQSISTRISSPTLRQRLTTVSSPKSPQRERPAPAYENEVPIVRLRRYNSTRGRFLAKIVCTLMFPVFVIIGFSGYELKNELASRQLSEELLYDLKLAPLYSSYSQDIEVEHIVANLMVDTNGNHYHLIFNVEWQDTNIAQGAFLDYARQYTGRLNSPTFQGLCDPTQFNDQRTEVKDYNLLMTSDLSQYDAVVSALFQAFDELADVARSQTVASRLYTFVAAMTYKSRIGDERRLMLELFQKYNSKNSTTMTADFTTSYVKYMTIVASQNVGFELFTTFAAHEWIRIRGDIMALPEAKIMTNFHDAMNKQDFTILANITFRDYFNNLTSLLNTLHTFQVELTDDVINYSETRMKSLFSVVMEYMWTLVLSLFGIIFMMYISASTLRTFGNDIAYLLRHNGEKKRSDQDLGEFSLVRACMSRFKVSFEFQILLTLIIPSLCMCGIILFSININTTTSVQTAQIRENIDICNAVVEAFNQLSLEGAESVKYLDDKTDLSSYVAQQPSTDQALNSLIRTVLSTLTDRVYSNKSQQLLANMALLDAHRAAFSANMDIVTNEELYTSMENGVLAILYELATQTWSSNIDHKMLVYVTMAKAKRYGGGGVSSQGVVAALRGDFSSSEEYGSYLSNLTASREWLSIAQRFSTEEELEVINVFTGSAEGQAFPVWEDILTTGNATLIAGVNAGEWFYLRAQGDVIMKQVHDVLAQNLVDWATADLASWVSLLLTHAAVLVVGGFLSLTMVMRSICKVRGFSRLMVEYLEKEEKRMGEVEMAQIQPVKEKPSVSGKPPDLSLRKRVPRARSNSTGDLRNNEISQVSNLLLADFRLDTSPDGHQSHHQAVLDFFSWISTSQGLVACNRMLFNRSDPGEGVHSLEFWNQLGELQILAAQSRCEATALRKAELGEEIYEKAERIYLIFVKDRLPEKSQAGPIGPNGPNSSPRNRRAKSVVGESPRNHSAKKDNQAGDSSDGNGSDASLVSPWRARMNSSLQEISPSNKRRKNSSVNQPQVQAQEQQSEHSRVRDNLSPPTIKSQQRHPQAQKRFSLTEVLDDPRRLATFKQYCISLRSVEIYDFLVAVRTFKRRCATLNAVSPEQQPEQTQSGVKPEQIVAEAVDIYIRFISDNAPSKINVSSTALHELRLVFGQHDLEEDLPQALQLEGVFDRAYNEIRRLMVHNILGNVLSRGENREPRF